MTVQVQRTSWRKLHQLHLSRTSANEPGTCRPSPASTRGRILSSSFPPSELMSQNPPETTSNSTYDLVFENALKAYKKKSGKDLASDPLLQRLETCNSPDLILGALREQIPNSDQSGTRNARFMDWLDPTVNVLLNFSETIGGVVNMVSCSTPNRFCLGSVS